MILYLFAFIAGFVTILSPCIFPLLPIILSSATGGHKRSLGIVTGFIFSFTFFTLFLSLIVRSVGIDALTLRNFSVVILIVFGLSLIVPKFQLYIEVLFSKLTGNTSNVYRFKGFIGGVIIGISLGLLWTPCVGPILAAVISLAISGEVTLQATFITFSYSLGTAIPMFGIMFASTTALKKIRSINKYTAQIQKGFGFLMLITGFAIYFGMDKAFQAYILETLPAYNDLLTEIDGGESVEKGLEEL